MKKFVFYSVGLLMDLAFFLGPSLFGFSFGVISGVIYWFTCGAYATFIFTRCLRGDHEAADDGIGYLMFALGPIGLAGVLILVLVFYLLDKWEAQAS